MTTSVAETAPVFPVFPAEGVTHGHVLVRPLRESDAQASLELAHDPDTVRWSPYFVTRPVDVDDALARVRRDMQQTLEGAAPHLAVAEVTRPDRLLGTIDARVDLPVPFRTVDVGYAVLPAGRGRGLASGALDALATWLLGPGGFARVQLDHAVENVASCRTARRAGFAQEGVRPSYLPLPHPEDTGGCVRHDTCLHGRLPDSAGSAAGETP